MPRPSDRRPGPVAAGADQPGRQRDQIHRARRDPGRGVAGSTATQRAGDAALLGQDTGIGIDRGAASADLRIRSMQVDASMTRRAAAAASACRSSRSWSADGRRCRRRERARARLPFWFTTPLGRSADERARASASGQSGGRCGFWWSMANAVSAAIMSRYFKSWRIDARSAPPCAEAEAAWQDAGMARHPFDVVIIDVKGLAAKASSSRASCGRQQARRPEVILLIGLDGSIADSQPGKPRRLRPVDKAAAAFGAVRLPGIDRLRGAGERIASFYVRKCDRQIPHRLRRPRPGRRGQPGQPGRRHRHPGEHGLHRRDRAQWPMPPCSSSPRKNST